MSRGPMVPSAYRRSVTGGDPSSTSHRPESRGSGPRCRRALSSHLVASRLFVGLVMLNLIDLTTAVVLDNGGEGKATR